MKCESVAVLPRPERIVVPGMRVDDPGAITLRTLMYPVEDIDMFGREIRLRPKLIAMRIEPKRTRVWAYEPIPVGPVEIRVRDDEGRRFTYTFHTVKWYRPDVLDGPDNWVRAMYPPEPPYGEATASEEHDNEIGNYQFKSKPKGKREAK